MVKTILYRIMTEVPYSGASVFLFSTVLLYTILSNMSIVE